MCEVYAFEIRYILNILQYYSLGASSLGPIIKVALFSTNLLSSLEKMLTTSLVPAWSLLGLRLIW